MQLSQADYRNCYFNDFMSVLLFLYQEASFSCFTQCLQAFLFLEGLSRSKREPARGFEPGTLQSTVSGVTTRLLRLGLNNRGENFIYYIACL